VYVCTGEKKIARFQLDEADEDSSEDASEENYYHSSFPTTNRKGIGPGLSFGDPVLNRLNKYKMAPPACLAKGNCVEEGDTSHDDWRALKQRSPTADEDMEHQVHTHTHTHTHMHTHTHTHTAALSYC
jgi:hypothetical protein